MTLPSGFHLYQVNNLNMHGMIRCMQISRTASTKFSYTIHVLNLVLYTTGGVRQEGAFE